MRVFVTGASGWIGSAAVDELLTAGHTVLGLARSDAAAATLGAKGVQVVRGDLDDLDSLRAGAGSADAVVHLANRHDWSDMAATNATERAATLALGETLAGTGRPLVLASGLAALASGRPADERDASPFHGPDSARGGSENLALEFADRGVRTVIARFAPTVHGSGDHGFIASLVAVAREKGVSGYPGDGRNRWAAVNRSDAGRLVALGLAQAPAGTVLHAVAEQGITSRDIAAAIGRAVGVPVAAVATDDVTPHFGWIGSFFGMDMTAVSDTTRHLLGWSPTGPTLVEDLEAGAYAVR